MKKLVALAFSLMLALVATPATAQVMGSPTSLPVSVGSIDGSIQAYVGGIAPKEITVVVTLMRFDNNGVYFPDLATSKRFGMCSQTVKKNCITRSTWKYSLSDDALPMEQYTPWRELDIRVEADGFYHHLMDQVRVWTGQGNRTFVPMVTLYELGVRAQNPYLYWIDSKVIAVGFWANSEYGEQELSVDFVFSGASWTKAEGKWGTLTYTETIGREWKWVERTFYAPQDGTENFGGSLCGEVQLRTGTLVFSQTKKVCASLQPPSWLVRK